MAALLVCSFYVFPLFIETDAVLVFSVLYLNFIHSKYDAQLITNKQDCCESVKTM